MIKTTKTAYFFKILNELHCGGFTSYKWPEVGVWTRRISGDLEICHKGFHLLRPSDLTYFWNQWGYDFEVSKVYLVEAEIEGLVQEDRSHITTKVATRRARLIKEMMLVSSGCVTFENKESIRRWMTLNEIVLEDY